MFPFMVPNVRPETLAKQEGLDLDTQMPTP
jgi:hypothetical protein